MCLFSKLIILRLAICFCSGMNMPCAAHGSRGQKYFMAGIDEPAVCASCDVLRQTAAWLDAYFAGKRPDPSRAFAGSAWHPPFSGAYGAMLLQIPYGQITTYGRLAEEAAQRMKRERMSAQAVGSAVGHNPISIIIPCHRVLGTDGGLRGYAGGIEIKASLLEHEGVTAWHR